MGNKSHNFRSININVIPSFGRIVNVVDLEKNAKVIFEIIKLVEIGLSLQSQIRIIETKTR
jgi:hypothetical protein